jgi:hypothetical protein
MRGGAVVVVRTLPAWQQSRAASWSRVLMRAGVVLH